MKLIYLSLSFIAGICLGMWSGLAWQIAAAAGAVSLLAFAVRGRRALLLVLCLLVFSGGVLRFQFGAPALDAGNLGYYNGGGAVEMRGLVAADPEVGSSTVALRLKAREMGVEDGWREVSGEALVYAPRYLSPAILPPGVSREPPYYRYGDIVQFRGELLAPPESELRRGTDSVVRYPGGLELLATGQGCKLTEWLCVLRDNMARALDGAMHEPQGSLAKAIVLGERSTLPGDLRASLSETGTAHILAVSGLHIAIVGGMVLALGVWLFGRRRPTYFILALVAVWGFAALTGMHAPAQRAAIMVSLWLLADVIGRPRSALPSLLFAAALMIGIHPFILREVSFQMSFAAMSGLVLLTPVFRSWGRRASGVTEDGNRALAFLVDSLSVTLGAVLATLPVIAYYFGQVSLVALPANFFALPALPFAIGFAALVALVGLFAPAAAGVLGWAAWLFISYIIEVVEFFAAIPFASVRVEVGAAFVWSYYAVLGAALLLVTRRADLGPASGRARSFLSAAYGGARRVPAKYLILPLFLVAALVWAAAITAPDGRLHVFFLDVGQGDAILLQRGHQQVLVDGGPDGDRLCLELGQRLPFWDRTIELVILTHPEADHVTGLVEVLRRYEVRQVLTNGEEHGPLVYGEWLRLLEEQDIRGTVARAGQRIALDEDICLNVLHPQGEPLEGTSSDVNNNSVVARLAYGDFSLLLTGDIFEEAERVLLHRRCSLGSTALKVPHHGSGTSCCPDFLGEVNPQLAVVSAARESPFHHPSPDVLGRLTELVGEDHLYLTSAHGTVELTTDGERLWVRTER